MTNPKVCRACQSRDAVPRRSRCQSCINAAQRASWAANREARLLVSRANYAKHAEKRRAESASYKIENREYYTLAEWFRKKGIPISHLDPADITALIDMKKAINRAKAQTRTK